MKEKDTLKSKFSSDYKKYYEVDLFRREGFIRKKCSECGRYFWTLDSERKVCPEPPCQRYDFLGNPPTSKRFDYAETWNQVEKYFVNNNHTSIKRYPVVCRWRPDLFFTVASIIDFQRVEGGEIIFDLPANPLIVPQMCLRFNDIQNVGVSGKHYSSFCMIGQHSISDEGKGYWKDRCVDLDFERFSWITQGTPTSYDAVFGPALKQMMARCNIEYDPEFYLRYARLAGVLN